MPESDRSLLVVGGGGGGKGEGGREGGRKGGGCGRGRDGLPTRGLFHALRPTRKQEKPPPPEQRLTWLTWIFYVLLQ